MNIPIIVFFGSQLQPIIQMMVQTILFQVNLMQAKQGVSAPESGVIWGTYRNSYFTALCRNVRREAADFTLRKTNNLMNVTKAGHIIGASSPFRLYLV